MVPDTSPDFLHPNFQYEDRRQEDRRQEVRSPIYEPTTVSLKNETLTIHVQLTDVSLCGFQIHHQSALSSSSTFTLCHGDQRLTVRTMWEQRAEPDVKIGVLREEVFLIHRLRRGDPDALWQLMAPHVEVLKKFAFSILHSPEDTDDVLQEVMMKVLMRCGQFHPGRSFRAWLMQITRNEALKLLRGARRRGTFAVSAEDDMIEADGFHGSYSSFSSPADLVELNELRCSIQNEVAALETKYRRVFLLRHWLQLDMPEVARQLGITVDMANTRLHRAHEAIRTRLRAMPGPASRTGRAAA